MAGVPARDTCGRRQRKKAETRAAIQRAALTLATGRGVEHVTVEDISEAADVSERTFFNYFSCKEDALVAESHVAARRLADALAARPLGEAPLRALRVAVTDSGIAELVRADRDDLLARHRLAAGHPSLLARQLGQYAALEEVLRATFAERLGADPAADMRPSLAASLAATALRVATRRWAEDGTRRLDDLLAEAFDLLERGVDTGKGGQTP